MEYSHYFHSLLFYCLICINKLLWSNAEGDYRCIRIFMGIKSKTKVSFPLWLPTNRAHDSFGNESFARETKQLCC